MAVVNPITKENAAAEVQDIYAKLTHVFGRMPNFFGIMAQRPAVLQSFLPLNSAIMEKGTVEPKYKELAYLKTSTVNGCEY